MNTSIMQQVHCRRGFRPGVESLSVPGNRAPKRLRTLGQVVAGLWLGIAGMAMSHAGTVTYVYTDPQGTPLAEADANGNITATFDYAPYGGQALGVPLSGPGYTGHVNDPESGLVYMQARYYDPDVGRFLSVDPVGPAPGNAFNFNRYGYANNNPTKFTDKDGRAPDTDFGLGAMARSAGSHPDQMKPALPFAIGALAGEIGAAELIVGAGRVIAKVLGGSRNTGEEIVSRLEKNAVKDDIRGNVRQIVKNKEHLKEDASAAMNGGKIKKSTTDNGAVITAEHSDGTRVSLRYFSGKDGSGPPTIQVTNRATKSVVKVRYEEH